MRARDGDRTSLRTPLARGTAAAAAGGTTSSDRDRRAGVLLPVADAVPAAPRLAAAGSDRRASPRHRVRAGLLARWWLFGLLARPAPARRQAPGVAVAGRRRRRGGGRASCILGASWQREIHQPHGHRAAGRHRVPGVLLLAAVLAAGSSASPGVLRRDPRGAGLPESGRWSAPASARLPRRRRRGVAVASASSTGSVIDGLFHPRRRYVQDGQQRDRAGRGRRPPTRCVPAARRRWSSWDVAGQPGPQFRRRRADVARVGSSSAGADAKASRSGSTPAWTRADVTGAGRARGAGTAAHRRVRPQGALRDHHHRHRLGRRSARPTRWSTCTTATPRSSPCSTRTCRAGSRSWSTRNAPARPAGSCSTRSTRPGPRCRADTARSCWPSARAWARSAPSRPSAARRTCRNRTDGMLLVGPPNSNALWRQFVADRDPGSPGPADLPAAAHGPLRRRPGRPGRPPAAPGRDRGSSTCSTRPTRSSGGRPRLMLQPPRLARSPAATTCCRAMRWYPVRHVLAGDRRHGVLHRRPGRARPQLRHRPCRRGRRSRRRRAGPPSGRPH